ncbi:MAG: hypothetical protein K6A90_16000 [Lachnospiraceae bacterium]|nr:hypothetical protein [Lachnospiraceae bacterium]
MKKKTLTKIISMVLSTALAVTSVQLPAAASEAEVDEERSIVSVSANEALSTERYENDDDYDDDDNPVSDPTPEYVTLSFPDASGTLSDGSPYEICARSDYTQRISIEGTMDIRHATGTVQSSDPSIIKISDGESSKQLISFPEADGKRVFHWQTEFTVCSYGQADLTFTVGKTSAELHIFVMDDNVITNAAIQKTGAGSALLSWKLSGNMYGVMVYERIRDKEYLSIPSPMAETKPGDISLAVTLSRTPEYAYYLVPYIIAGEGTKIAYSYALDYFYDTSDYWPPFESITICLKTLADENADKCIKNAIQTIVNTGSGQKVTWRAVEDAVSYQLLCCNTENGKYEPVSNKTESFEASVKKKRGFTYYYKVRAFYPDGTHEDSDSLGVYFPLKKPAKVKSVELSTKQTVKDGQYDGTGNWSSADETYYYTSGGKLHVVVVKKKKLYDYTLDSKYKVKKKKTVNIGAHDTWGAFYHGEDGNNYVAVGFFNENDLRDKTVIRIMKYSADWKNKQVCDIPGGVTFLFEGIWDQFRAGNGRFALDGNNLALLCARGMFADESGTKHQSNIGFMINTQDMSYQVANFEYASHSFNQFVKFQNGTAYQLDHGDGIPRGIRLCVIPKLKQLSDGTEEYFFSTKTNSIYDLFKFQGNYGDNYTGGNVGGMEIGKNNVLVTGRSTPQGETICGVTGNKKNMLRNVFLICAAKDGSGQKMIWLTKYNPKKKNMKVGESRIIKLSDDMFAIMYSTYKGKSQKATLHYVLVNEKGEILKKKTYKNMVFTGGTQPILFAGSLFWSDAVMKDGKTKVYHYSIPVLTK